MEPRAAPTASRTSHAGARRTTSYERPTPGATATGRAETRTRNRSDGTKNANERVVETDGQHRRHMLLARMTRGAQQRKAEQAAIHAIADPGARKAAERESRSSYENSPEDHAGRRIGKKGLKIDKPKLESAFENIGKDVGRTTKRIQRDIRYTLAPPDKRAMRIGGGGHNAPAERPSAAARPACVQERIIPKTLAQPEHAR